ncbi:MAG: capsular polysaccharide synthesis protein [Selenomonas sp.]|nr:capsular polysaccharide synthesis protein [Selenomonas sp.]
MGAGDCGEHPALDTLSKTARHIRGGGGALDAETHAYQPGVLPKVIWWCWLQGVDAAPPICRACLRSLIETLPDDWQIFIVTEANYHELVTLPEAVERKYRAGRITRTHFSDILRTALLAAHGGVWIDATVYCTGDASAFLARQELFAYQHIYRGIDEGFPGASWLIAAIPHHPILEATLTLLDRYWQDHDALVHYYTFQFLWYMAAEKYLTLWRRMPQFSDVPPELLANELLTPYSEQRMAEFRRMSDFHKLTYKIAPIPEAQLRGTFLEKILARADGWQPGV